MFFKTKSSRLASSHKNEVPVTGSKSQNDQGGNAVLLKSIPSCVSGGRPAFANALSISREFLHINPNIDEVEWKGENTVGLHNAWTMNKKMKRKTK